MKIRSLLLGSLAAAGLSTAGYAADLGVITALDVCDELGISGLSISSDDNCLVISGGVEFGLNINNYAGGITYANGRTISADAANFTDSISGAANLDFEATAPTDFGPATAFISLTASAPGWDVMVDEAWVSVGDTTVVTAGKKGSLYGSFLDAPEGAYDFEVDSIANDVPASDMVFQVTSALADGFSIGGSIESDSSANPWGVGVVSYQGNGFAAEGHVAAQLNTGAWAAYGAFQGYFDPMTIAAAIEIDDLGNWDAIVGAAVTVDMFTLAAEYWTEDGGDWTASGHVGAAVAEGVTINLDSEYFDIGGTTGWEVAVGVEAAVTETLTASAEVGMIDETGNPAAYWATAGLTWAPGGDTEFGVDGTVYSEGGMGVAFSASKDFQ